MAIFFNGKMQSAPRVNEQISGGRAQISGGDSGFAYQEAKTMVDWLQKAGIANKIDNDSLDEMIEDYEYFEAHEHANTLRKLKEKDIDFSGKSEQLIFKCI